MSLSSITLAIRDIRDLPGDEETKKRREDKIQSLLPPLDGISFRLQKLLNSERDEAQGIVYKCQKCGDERPTEGLGSHSHPCLKCEGQMTRNLSTQTRITHRG